MPTKKDLTVFKGDTYTLPLRLMTNVSGDAKNPVLEPIDLTGEVMRFHAWWGNDQEIEIDSATGSFDIVDAVEGRCLLLVPHTDTERMPYGAVNYKIQRVGQGMVKTMLYGVLKTKGIHDNG